MNYVVTGEYLDYKNCKCRQRIAALTEKCRKNIDENEMIYNETLDVIPLNVYEKVCSSWTRYIELYIEFCLFLLLLKKEDDVSRVIYNQGATHTLIN